MQGETRTSKVREEDSIDLDALTRWMADQEIAYVTPLAARQFRGGASNLTYLISDSQANSWVLRTPPHGAKIASAHDMGREARVLTALSAKLDHVPSVVGYCGDESYIGREFYLMEFIDGHIMVTDIPSEMCETPEQTRAMCEAMVDALAQLHNVDLVDVGLVDLDRGPGYVARQVGGWSKRYRAARTPDVPEAEDVMQWLDVHQPPDVAHVLIHGDWRFDNLVMSPKAEIAGILDWEMSTVGDPCMDLGSALAYWVQADDSPEFRSLRMQPTDAPGMLTRSEVVERYSQSMSVEVRDSLSANWLFYEVFGLFRLAVIVQQIWARYQAGTTTNPQFAGFGSATNMLINRAQSLLAQPSSE